MCESVQKDAKPLEVGISPPDKGTFHELAIAVMLTAAYEIGVQDGYDLGNTYCNS
jgi:hypothetical protein